MQEAYVGEYASGKSEVALNRALLLLKQGGEPVTLVDFDLVEPFYTLRPLKRELEGKGLQVVAGEPGQITGLGETGNILLPASRWALKRKGHVIIDVGYGVSGVNKLELLESSERLTVYAVVNIARPLTGDVRLIIDYIKELGKIDGLINNSHLGDDTDEEIINKGAELVTEAALILNLPVRWTCVDKSLRNVVGEKDKKGNPVMYLTRYMSRAYW